MIMLGGHPKKDAGNAGNVHPTKVSKSNTNGATLGFEAQPFLTADKPHKNFERPDYSHIEVEMKHAYPLNTQRG